MEIGDRNRIRESVTIHRGTVQGGGLTKVGNDNLLMINAHVAHDCTLGDRCILANNATLAGHVSLDDYVIIGGMTAVHQFCVIGSHVMVGGCSGVAQDVPPFVIARGNHATPFGVNIEGLKRRGFSGKQSPRSATRINCCTAAAKRWKKPSRKSPNWLLSILRFSRLSISSLVLPAA